MMNQCIFGFGTDSFYVVVNMNNSLYLIFFFQCAIGLAVCNFVSCSDIDVSQFLYIVKSVNLTICSDFSHYITHRCFFV